MTWLNGPFGPAHRSIQRAVDCCAHSIMSTLDVTKAWVILGADLITGLGMLWDNISRNRSPWWLLPPLVILISGTTKFFTHVAEDNNGRELYSREPGPTAWFIIGWLLFGCNLLEPSPALLFMSSFIIGLYLECTPRQPPPTEAREMTPVEG